MFRLFYIVLVALTLIATDGICANSWSPQTPNKVSGYNKKDGTHVDSYYRASRKTGY